MSECENLDGQCAKSWCNCDEVRRRAKSSFAASAGSRSLSVIFHALESGEGVSLDERMDAAKSVLAEVMSWHADPDSPDYNQCERPEERCHWCCNAALVIGEIHPGVLTSINSF